MNIEYKKERLSAREISVEMLFYYNNFLVTVLLDFSANCLINANRR
jgi:hypothetical protein